jgi:peptide/nickel transport system substrate-binding protein
VAIFAALLLALACTPAAPPDAARTSAAPEPRAGGVLTMAFPSTESGDATTLDPQNTGGTYVNSILPALYDSLVYQDPRDSSLKPGLAEAWEVSADGLSYTFHLRQNVKFHDGNPFNAEAVRFTLDRAVDPAARPGNAASARLMPAYDHTEIVDDATARVVLKTPQANFLSSAVGRSYLSIVSPRAVERLGLDGFGEHPVGSGPYRFVEWQHGAQITLERNPDYAWGPPLFERGGPPLVDRIVFRYIPEPSTRLAALESGEVNAIDGIPEADQDRLAHDPRFEIIPVRKNGTTGRLTLNNHAFPTNERAVRVALNQAVDRVGTCTP